MNRLSPAAALAWKIAMFEALQAGSELLEKEHLLIGLCSLEKVIRLEDLSRDLPVAAGVLHERDALDFSLRKFSLDASKLRRGVRDTLPPGRRAGNVRILHRSPDCRKYFDRANEIAGKNAVTSIHLLQSVLEDPGPKIIRVLKPRSSGGEPAAAPRVRAQLTLGVRQFQDADEHRHHLMTDIQRSVTTLASLPPASGQSLRLRREVQMKTLQVARLCLDLGDLSNLLPALRDLAEHAVDLRARILGLCAQLEFMRNEGIPLSDPSKDRIRSVLDNLEQILVREGTG